MQSSIGKFEQHRSGDNRTMIRQEYRSGYEIPLLPHQRYGILSKLLWPSRTQVIRIVPGYDPRTGEVFHQNINVDQWATDRPQTDFLSDTFRMATVCERFGSIGSTFVTDYAPDSPDAQKYGGETVIRNFARSIIFACTPSSGSRGFRERLKPIAEWRQWVGNGMGNATLQFTRDAFLMQALVFHVNGRNNQDLESGQDLVDEDGDIMPLMAVCAITNKGSIERLVNALVRPMDRSRGLLDPFTNSELGPVAELEGNELFLNPIQVTEQSKQRTVMDPSVQPAGQQGWTPTPYPLTEDAVKQLWVPWDNLLAYMTAEEQIRLCAKEFGADTVNYVLGTNPRFSDLPIPDDIRAAGLGRYAATGGSVSYTTTAKAPAPAGPSFSVGQRPATPASAGLPKPSGLPKAAGLGARPPAAAAPAAPAPAQIPGVPASSGVDQDALMAQLKKIRAASAAGKTQASAAADLLGMEE